MNNTQFDIWFERVKQEPEILKNLLTKLFGMDAIEFDDFNVYASDMNDEESLQDEVDELKDRLYEYTIENERLKQDIKHLKENLG